jgi:hypothetical protein
MYNANDRIMRRTFLLFTIIIFVALFDSCDHCNDTLDDKNFTLDEINIVPYTGNETIVLKDSVGDSICLTGQGRRSAMIYRSSNPEYDNNDCSTDYRNSEVVYFDYKFADMPDTTFSIWLDFYRPFYDKENVKDFTIFFYDKSGNDGGHSIFSATYTFEVNSLMNPVSGSYFTSYISEFYNTFTLLNKTFTSVYEFRNPYFGSFSVYYSIDQGLIGYIDSAGTKWYLDKIN